MKKTSLFLTSPLALIASFLLMAPVSAEELSCTESTTPMQAKIGEVVNCSLETESDVDVFAIAFEEDDLIAVHVMPMDDDCESGFRVEVLNKKNDRLDIESSPNCEAIRAETVIRKAGVHTVTVSSSYREIGSYQVKFECISGSCISQALLPKKECSASFDGTNLNVPHLEFDSKIYTVDFKMISGDDPIQLEVINVGEK